MVDRSDPQLFSFAFTAKEADDSASVALGKQNAVLDTRVQPLGKLVVFLHGAGAPTSCGGGALSKLVASWGFHWFAPCYLSDIGGCRLEAIEGVDHHAFIDVKPPDSVERRVVQGLHHLATENAQGDWLYYLDGDKPKWSQIIISGISHGASSAGLLGMYRNVSRVVMLSGPLDLNQAWLKQTPITPIDRYFGFTHTLDEQHEGHLAAFETLKLPGTPTIVDGGAAPYGGSHRLVTSLPSADGHSSTGDGNIESYVPVWQTMYGM
jgi:hypothetical protein